MSFSFLLAIFVCFTKLCYCVENLGSCTPSYMRLTSQHTMCIDSNRTCIILRKGVNEEDKHLILQLHNTFRSKLATGGETLGAVLSSAADMLEMTWDYELASIAQKHAELCTYTHDCYECRSVEHFMVGQNLGAKLLRLVPVEEEKDWSWFLNLLYSEVSRFPESTLNAYVTGPLDPKTQYGHFSQIVWGNTWRIGCGWVLFQAGNYNNSLYVCNYGPSGNILKQKVYTEGPSCSSCPRNSCCGEKCAEFNIAANYPGLCKVIDENLPPDGFGPRDANDNFFCDFNDEPDCETFAMGKKDWKIMETIAGKWISIILNGDETAMLLMVTPLISNSPRFCFKVILRTGAVVEGQPCYLSGVITFLQSNGKKSIFTIKGTDDRTQFISYSMDATMSQGVDMVILFAFTVVSGVPPQYLEIKEISARTGQCPPVSNSR